MPGADWIVSVNRSTGKPRYPTARKQIVRFLWIYFFVSIFATAALPIDTWPHHPTSILTWVLLFAISLPVTLLGEWLGDGLMDNPLTVSIERGTRGSKLSWARIAYFVAMLVLLAICAAALLYWAQSPW
jgi:hypothetical protein